MIPPLPNQGTFAVPSREQWLALVEKDLNGAPFDRRLVTQLIEGLSIGPLYTSTEAPAPDRMGLPGQPPFARGSTTLRPRNAGWCIVGEHRHPLPVVANRAILSDLAHGADAILVRLSPRLLANVADKSGCRCGGSGGVLVDSVDDLDLVFADVDLARVPVTIAAGPAFYCSAAQLMALYRRRGIADDQVHCQWGADPLGTFAARGTLPRSAETMLCELGSLARIAVSRCGGIRAVTVSTAAYDDAGATAVQELAAALSTAVMYLRAMQSAGLSVAQASQQILFSLAVGVDQFLEIAKFRALRILMHRVLEVWQVPESDRTILLHGRTSRRVLTRRDPWVNVLRTTIGCFAAALGGADQITILPFDDVIGPSDANAQRLARNTQIILEQEGELGRVLDAAGGSYYVEHLTLSLAEAAWTLFQDLERRGGMLSVLRDGSFAGQVEATWQTRSKDLARRKVPITGVSEFPNLGEHRVERPAIDTLPHETELLQRRANRATDSALQSTIDAATMASEPARFDAFWAAAARGATLLTMHQALGTEGEATVALRHKRFAAAYEKLRDHSDASLAERGRRPRVFSANMGPLAVYNARATYARNCFEAGGFEVLDLGGFVDVSSAVEAFARSGTKNAVICSSDPWYEQGACVLGRALKEQGAERVILAGNPGPRAADYQQSGIDSFIFIGADVLGVLTELARAEMVSP